MKHLIFSILLLCVPTALSGKVTVSAIFSDNMLVQRDKPIAVWGKAGQGEGVTVTMGEASVVAKADQNGEWRATLPALSQGRDLTLTIVGDNTITIGNIVVGEVWICSGQSNMATRVEKATTGAAEVPKATHPDIRLGSSAGWKVCTPENAATYSAVAYFFARDLHAKLGVPIGVITEARPGSTIEAMTPFEGHTLVKEVFDKYKKKAVAAIDGQKKWLAELEKVEPADEHKDFVKMMVRVTKEQISEMEKALSNNTRVPGPPYFPRMAERAGIKIKEIKGLPPISKVRMPNPACNYKHLRAVEGYPARGFIWYQGESNQYEGTFYYHRLKALIAYWRQLIWKDATMPFYIVQIAPNNYRGDLPALWEAQLRALDIPSTELAHTCDVGYGLHPKNKEMISQRLALIALASNYGHREIIYRGPRFKSAKVEGERIKVTFDFIADGLRSSDGKPLTFFEVAGEDDEYVSAHAVIEGNAVVVSSDQVKQPKHVRFAWKKNAVHNLQNGAGLPAYPFRTDTPVPIVRE